MLYIQRSNGDISSPEGFNRANDPYEPAVLRGRNRADGRPREDGDRIDDGDTDERHRHERDDDDRDHEMFPVHDRTGERRQYINDGG